MASEISTWSESNSQSDEQARKFCKAALRLRKNPPQVDIEDIVQEYLLALLMGENPENAVEGILNQHSRERKRLKKLDESNITINDGRVDRHRANEQYLHPSQIKVGPEVGETLVEYGNAKQFEIEITTEVTNICTVNAQTALNTLDPVARDIFEQAHKNGMSRRDIAQQQEMTKKGVEASLARSKRRLKKYARKHGLNRDVGDVAFSINHENASRQATSGEMIRQIRGGETQKAFATRIGVRRETLSQWENNKCKPSKKKVQALCRLYPAFASVA